AFINHPAPTIATGPSGVVTTGDVNFTYTYDDTDVTFKCTPEVNGQLQSGSALTNQACAAGNLSAHYSNLIDGPQTFQVAAYDNSQDPSATATRQFTVDTHPPAAFDLVSPADGATTDTNPTLSWKTATDVSAVTYALMLDGQK